MFPLSTTKTVVVMLHCCSHLKQIQTSDVSIIKISNDSELLTLSCFSSPESKVKVSFSDQKYVSCLSALSLVSVGVVVVVVNFSHFNLFLQNHWANFNQTCHKVSVGERKFSLKEAPHLFSRGDNLE